mmetsp:Transcript_33627/g.60537  ORF Transcript_33627/g.60537 Transcript_33627/m.60537 type:complete len:119 (-) Transcript_33627:23-379(-)
MQMVLSQRKLQPGPKKQPQHHWRLLTCHLPPQTHFRMMRIFTTWKNKSHDSKHPNTSQIMPLPVPPPKDQLDERGEGVVLEKTTTTSVSVDGTNQVTEVTLIQNADGTATKKTQVRTQ